MKKTLERIADALEKMVEPVELGAVDQEQPEPVCPACQAKDPQVLLTAEAAAQVQLSGAMTFSLELICMSCNSKIILRPVGLQIEKAEGS